MENEINKPLTNGDEFTGKDKKTGKFLPGHKLAKGNPCINKQKHYKELINAATTDAQVLAIWQVIYEKAVNSKDLDACKYFLSRTAGEPKHEIDISITDISADIKEFDNILGISDLIQEIKNDKTNQTNTDTAETTDKSSEI